MEYIINALAFIGLIALSILAASLFTRPRFRPRDNDEDDIGNWIDRLKL
jgi:hypothetical protein